MVYALEEGLGVRNTSFLPVVEPGPAPLHACDQEMHLAARALAQGL
jgi:hypothetical protein